MAKALQSLMGFLSALAGWTNDNLGGRIMRPFIEKAIHALSAQGAKLSAKTIITELAKLGFSPETIRGSALFKYAAPTLLTAGAGALNVKVPDSVFGDDIRQAKELEAFLNNIIDRAGEGASAGIATSGADAQTMPGVTPGTMVYGKAHNMPGLSGYRHLAIQGQGDQVSTVCSAVDRFYEENALRDLVMKMGLRRLDRDTDVAEIEPHMSYHLPQEVDHLPDCPHCLGKLMGHEDDEFSGPNSLEVLLTADEKVKWAAVVRHVAAHEHRVAMEILKKGRVAILRQEGLVDVLKLALQDIEIGRESFSKDGKNKVLPHGVKGAEHDSTGNQVAPSAQGVIDVLYLMDEVQVDGVTEWRQLLDESVDGNWWQAKKRQAAKFVAKNGAFGVAILGFLGSLAVILVLGLELTFLGMAALGETFYVMSWMGGPDWMFANPIVPGILSLLLITFGVAIVAAPFHFAEKTVFGLKSHWPSFDEAVERLPAWLHWLKSERAEAGTTVYRRSGVVKSLALTLITAHLLYAVPVLIIGLEAVYLFPRTTEAVEVVSRLVAFISLVMLGFWMFSATRGAFQEDKNREEVLLGHRGANRFMAFMGDSAYSAVRSFNWSSAVTYVLSICVIPVVWLFTSLSGWASSSSVTTSPIMAGANTGFFMKLTGVPGGVHLAVFVGLLVVGLVLTVIASSVRNRAGSVVLGSLAGLCVILFLVYFGIVGPGLTVAKQFTDVGHGDGFFEAATYDWAYPDKKDKRRAKRRAPVSGYTTTPPTATPPVVSQPAGSDRSDEIKKARQELAEYGW